MLSKSFSVVLVEPEIPGNTGSIGRTCLALGVELILIKPYGFDLNEQSVRRAGLDYWKFVNITEYSSWDEFLEQKIPPEESLIYFSKAANKTYYHAPYCEGCYLVFGNETKGLDQKITARNKSRLYRLPIYSEHVRSLNLSNAATAACYEAVRHLSSG